MKKIALYFIFFITLNALGQIDSDLSGSNAQKFDEILRYISKLYVDSIDQDDLTNAAIISMLEELDPHSSYISKEEVAEANSSINGSFVGIGIRYQILRDTLLVIATIPGGPSEKIGIKSGDKIISVNDENIAGVGLKTNQVKEKLMGELGTKVTVDILRKNANKKMKFVIARDNIPIYSVDANYMITPTIGYIKLNSFSRTTYDEIHKALKELKDKGMEHLILDLQGNGGGLLDASQKVADEFLDDGNLIVYSQGRAQPRSDLKAYKKGTWEKGSLILLTDEYTASASEILSGAIQDWDRGLIVGRRTYGKGLVQRPIDLTDGSQIRLTIARYYTPSGRFIQKPYDDVEAYRNDLTDRFEKGEFVNKDSIKLVDSLVYYTLKTKRTVYGGGGIMPDIFVPLDTINKSDFFSEVNQLGHVNSFSLQYTDDNRDKLLAQFPNFENYISDFSVDDEFISDFLSYVKQQDSTLICDEKELEKCTFLLKRRFKAMIAQDVWGYNQFYQIFNEENEILQRAIKAINEGEYEKMNLDQTNK